MIKKGILKEDLNVDSFSRKRNGSCPLFPEEVLHKIGFCLSLMVIFLICP